MSGGIYTTDKSKTLQSLADVEMDNIQNNQAPVYNSTTEIFENKHVATSSSSISGSSGDVVIADGSGGVLTTNRLNVDDSNGHITGTLVDIKNTETHIGLGATGGTDSISIGYQAGSGGGLGFVAVGTASGGGAGNRSVSLGYLAWANNDNSIVINSSGTLLQSSVNSACYINPIRTVDPATLTSPYVVQYDDTKKEIIKSDDLHTRDIVCRDIQNNGSLTNVGTLSNTGTASLYGGQLTAGTTANRVIIGAPSSILSVDLANRRVGINVLNPTEDLDVDGNIQLNSATTSKIVFYDSNDAHEHAEIDATDDGTNGGQLQLHTKVDGGSVSEKLRINNVGAIGIGGANYGTAGQVLTSNGSGSAVSWANVGGTPIYAGAQISKTITNVSENVLNNWTSQVASGITFATTNVFTTPTTGWYSLGFSLEFKATSTANVYGYCLLRIKRSGSTYHTLRNDDAYAVGSDVDLSRTFGGSILINMSSATDYITFTAEADSGSYTVTGMASLVKVS